MQFVQLLGLPVVYTAVYFASGCDTYFSSYNLVKLLCIFALMARECRKTVAFHDMYLIHQINSSNT